ncbi:DNA-binding protein [Candidatus Saccharibacteria bacterium]|nr:DNA-binding protein [Candidatus Saccharibacteria bacterium]
MRLVAKRLTKGMDLKKEIEAMVLEHDLPSATVASAVGSLTKLVVRMAGAKPDQQDIRTIEDHFEIVSLIGNLGPGRTHLHIAVSDKEGKVIGGHLKEGSIVHVTAEIVLISDEKTVFSEKPDTNTGFGELSID